MLYLLFFCSGVSGLIYEVVWVREFGNVFGNTVYSASLVTAVFMLGLGVGSYVLGKWADRRYAANPDSLLRAYGHFELAIAAMGLAISACLPHLSDLSALASSYSQNVRGWYVLSMRSYLMRGVIAVVLLAPVTVLMGGTLTLLIRHLVRKNLEVETRRIAVLYGVNTAGAALGAFLTDFTLVPTAGYRGAQIVAVLLNLGAALGALLLASRGVPAPSVAAVDPPAIGGARLSGPAPGRARRRRTRAPEVAPVMAPPPPVSSHAVAFTSVALALSGFAAMGMEILWFRHFTLLLGGFRAVFSLLLTVILTGIGVGSLMGSLLIRRTTRPAEWLIGTLGLFVTFTLLGLAAASLSSIDAAVVLARTPDAGASLAGTMTELWLNVRPILMEVAVPALLMGLAYPLANATIQRTEDAVGRHAGVLYLANTIGAACGVLAAGFLLLPVVGMQATASILTITGGLAVVPLFLATQATRETRETWTGAPGARMTVPGMAALGGVTLLGSLAVGLWLLLPANYMIARATAYGNANARLLALDEGVNEIVAVTEVPGEGRRLFTDGHPMSATTRMSQRYMRALAHIPLLLVDRPDAVLVIGFGVGNTTHAATLHPSVRRVEVADLSTQVLAHASYFKEANKDVLSDPRVVVYVNDGRQHLRMRPAASYDLITLEPPPLALSGVGALYSREFYALARTRLKPGGYISQWLPQYQVPLGTLRAMIRAFVDVFPQAVLLGGTDEELLLVGTNDSRIEVDPDHLTAALSRAPAAHADLQRIDLGSAREIVGTFVASAQTLTEASRATAAVTDDRPVQEYGAGSRLTWIRIDGVPPSLVDLKQVASWCPRCFVGGEPVPLVNGLDAYLELLDPLYKQLIPPAEGAGSVADPRITRLIDGSPYLREILGFHASRRNARGDALAAEGKFDEAIMEFRNGLRLNPDSAELFWNLGRALVARGGSVAEAIHDLRRSVELDPDQGRPHYDLASTLLDLHRYDEAIEEFRAAIRVMPTSSEAHNNLGIALGSKGKLEEAIDEFQQAVKLQPENAEARHNLTSALEAVSSGNSRRSDPR